MYRAVAFASNNDSTANSCILRKENAVSKTLCEKSTPNVKFPSLPLCAWPADTPCKWMAR